MQYRITNTLTLNDRKIRVTQILVVFELDKTAYFAREDSAKFENENQSDRFGTEEDHRLLCTKRLLRKKTPGRLLSCPDELPPSTIAHNTRRTSLGGIFETRKCARKV
mmetsp:Transcript_413/g.938  ORF Transcript_413/g.938 Transcript_413/m.938 type:complete len:108 (-) Transcript_413:10-333(-)